jgi:hypothetical protein
MNLSPEHILCGLQVCQWAGPPLASPTFFLPFVRTAAEFCAGIEREVRAGDFAIETYPRVMFAQVDVPRPLLGASRGGDGGSGLPEG